MKYTFIFTGQCKLDGNFYRAECMCDGMSKDEISEFIKEQNFVIQTVKIKKEKTK